MDRSIPAAVPAQACRPALDSAKRLNRRQKPPSCGHFSGIPRHLPWERGKNSRNTSEISLKNGAVDCGFEFAKPNLKSPFKKPVGGATGSIMLGKRFDGRKVNTGSAIASHGNRDRGGAY
jgi:hypothetical protein